MSHAETLYRAPIGRVTSFDPIQSESLDTMRCVSLVYEPLLEYDYLARPYRLKGCLAEDLPTRSNQGRTLTFRLRPNIHFGPDRCFQTPTQSREVTAEDVIFSFKRLADAKLSSPGYWTLEGKIVGIDAFYQASMESSPTDYSREIKGLKALDRYTLQIDLTTPTADFLWMLAMPYTAIVPHEAVDFYGSKFETVEVGTGPYRLTSWRRNYRYAFERRPGRDCTRDATPILPNAQEAVPIDRITYWVIEDPSTRWLSFLSGNLDHAGEISRDNWDAIIDSHGHLTPEMQRRGIQHFSQPSLDTFYIGFNLDDPILGQHPKLRQALTCASDASQWEALNAGRVVGATGPVPPGIAGRLTVPSPFAYNPEKARELLAEAGFPNGIDPKTNRRLTLTLDLGRTDQEIRETAELFASFMNQIGIVVKLQYNNWPSFLKKIARRESQLFLIGWMADYPSALNFLHLFISRNASPGPNRSNYSNPAYDALFDQADQTLDEADRLQIIETLQYQIREAAPWIFLYHRKTNCLLPPHIRNVILHDFPYGIEKHWRIQP